MMLKFLSLCLGGEQPVVSKTPAAQPAAEFAPVNESGTPISSVDHKWQALYDSLHTVRGSWHERLCQVTGLAAASCGTAFVSVHLFCPHHACFVVISSAGPQAEMLQPGDLQPIEPCGGQANSRHNSSSPRNIGSFRTSGCSSVSPGEPSSLQLLVRGNVTIYRSASPPAVPPLSGPRANGANNGDTSNLPSDWRRMHYASHLTEFAAVPIFDAGGAIIAAVTAAGPASATASGVADLDGSGVSNGANALVRLSAQLPQLERFAGVLGLAFFSDPKTLAMFSLAASALAALQHAETLQAMVGAIHEGFGSLLERHFRLEGTRCVLAFADAMEARVAYFGPPAGLPQPVASPVAAGTGNPGSSVAAAVIGNGAAGLLRGNAMNGSSPQGPAGAAALFDTFSPLQGVLGPLLDTLLLDIVTQEAPGSGRVLTNCRAYLQQEDKPGRDVQVCFQLCRMPPACLVMAVASAADSTLAPEVALYVCTAQQQLPAGLLEDARVELQYVLQLLMPHIHRQLLGPLAAEWGGMRLQAAAGTTGGGGAGAAQSNGASTGGGDGASASVNSVLAGLSGAVSLGGLCRTVSFSVDDLVSHSPAHLKVVVAGIQSTITSAQMNQAWQSAGDTSTREAIDDLYSIRLRETVGQGGQGVVFRGLMHGLEVAVKVVAKDMPGALIAKVQQQQQQAWAAGGRRGNGAGGAPGGNAAPASRPVDPEQVLRTAKRELIRDALELAVTSAVNHPHIVQVHNYFFDVLVVGYAQDDSSAPSRTQDPGGGATCTPPSTLSSNATSTYLRLVRRVDATEEMVSEGPTNLVIVMEYCDAGTLKDVLRRGYFKRGMDTNSWPRLDLMSMYICLLEVALALRHMHSLALVHCDLKPSNVLLRSHPRDPRGWTCKLSDFGCVRMLKPPAEDGTGPTFPHFTVTRALGTLTHMAPEVITKGALLTSSVDIYSFGIMMAELVTGVPQDQCMPGKEAIQLARKGVRPTLPSYCPKEYRDVAAACWSHDPHARPTAAELVNVLQLLLNQVQGNSQSSSSFAQSLPQIFQQHLATEAGRSHGAGAPGPRGALVPSPLMGANGGRTLAAAAAMAAAAMQQVNNGGGSATNNPAAAAAAAPLLGSGNILVTPLQPSMLPAPLGPLGGVSGGGAGGGAVESVAAAAAVAMAFAEANPAQGLAGTLGERVMLNGGVPAVGEMHGAVAPATSLRPPDGGGIGIEKMNPKRILASTLSASFHHRMMLQQMQQQMHQHQHQQQVQQHQQFMRQALQQQMAQMQAQQQQQHLLNLPQHEQQVEPLQMLLFKQQQQQQQQEAHHPQGPIRGADPGGHVLPTHLSFPSAIPESPNQQQAARLVEPSMFAAAAAAAPMPSAGLAASSHSGLCGLGGAVGMPKPSSFTSAASAFSAAGAISPTASSLSSSARQLPSQLPPPLVNQHVSASRDGAGTLMPGCGGAAASITTTPPVALLGSPVVIANTTSDQDSSAARTEYDTPAEINSGAACSDAATPQRALTSAAGAHVGGAGAGGLYATIDADMLFNTAGSTPMREPSYGPEAAMVAAAAQGGAGGA